MAARRQVLPSQIEPQPGASTDLASAAAPEKPRAPPPAKKKKKQEVCCESLCAPHPNDHGELKNYIDLKTEAIGDVADLLLWSKKTEVRFSVWTTLTYRSKTK